MHRLIYVNLLHLRFWSHGMAQKEQLSFCKENGYWTFCTIHSFQIYASKAPVRCQKYYISAACCIKKRCLIWNIRVLLLITYMQDKWSGDVRANPVKALGVYTGICYVPPVIPRCANRNSNVIHHLFPSRRIYAHKSFPMLCFGGFIAIIGNRCHSHPVPPVQSLGKKTSQVLTFGNNRFSVAVLPFPHLTDLIMCFCGIACPVWSPITWKEQQVSVLQCFGTCTHDLFLLFDHVDFAGRVRW